MYTSTVISKPLLAQSSEPSPLPSPAANTTPVNQSSGQIWMFFSLGLVVMLIGLIVYGRVQLNTMAKKIRFEKFKTKETQKKLALALQTIQKMEGNPDLIHSREFNLDYLRMRMDEEAFHFAVVNKIRNRVKQLISTALRPKQADESAVGIASLAGRQVDRTFDVEYETDSLGKRSLGVLFRIQIKLTKLPTQASSATISQIIDCIEHFLQPDDDTWQPTIQGRIVSISWDQKAKPTPLLVLQQSSEGVNVTLRTQRKVNQ